MSDRPETAPPPRELLAAYLRQAPLARSLIRSRELELMIADAPPGRLIDLGHGDGLFARLLERYGVQVFVGVDRSLTEIQRARGRSAARLVVADMERLPFRNNVFSGAVSNCVLEHVAGLDAALQEAGRVMQDGGRFLASVVTDRYESMLFWSRFLGRLRLAWTAHTYIGEVRRRFLHLTMLAPAAWRTRAESFGFRVVALRPYVGPRRQLLMDLFLPFLLVNKFLREHCQREVILPVRWPAGLIAQWLAGDAEENREGRTANLLLVLEKVAVSKATDSRQAR